MRNIIFLLFFLFIALEAKEFHIGFYSPSVSDFSKSDLLIATSVYINEVGKDEGYTANPKIYENIDEMVEDLTQGKLDYITASGLDFVKHFDMSLLTDGFIKGYKDGSADTLVILVSKGSSIKSVEDLYNKRVAFKENDSLAQLYITNRILKKYADDRVVYEKQPTRQRALLKLFFGKVDAAVTTSKTFSLLSELNPQISKKVHILQDSKLFADNFGLMSRSTDLELVKFVVEGAKKLHTHTRGKQLLTLYKTERIVDSKIEDLRPIQTIYEETEALKRELKNR